MVFCPPSIQAGGRAGFLIGGFPQKMFERQSKNTTNWNFEARGYFSSLALPFLKRYFLGAEQKDLLGQEGRLLDSISDSC